jgi:hypothetical protein
LFGVTNDRGTNVFTQVEIPGFEGNSVYFVASWMDRSVPALGQSDFSIEVRWGSDSARSAVTLDQQPLAHSIPLEASIRLSGMVSDPNGDTDISLYAVVNNRLSQWIPLAESVSNSFQIGIPVRNLTTRAEVCTVVVYGFDVVAGPATARFICQNHRLVTNTQSYWPMGRCFGLVAHANWERLEI